MCCKTTKDDNGNDSTFCSAKPDEVRTVPIPPMARTTPIEGSREPAAQQSAELIIVGDCTFGDDYVSTCQGKGGYLTCDGGTPMCCKETTTSKGHTSTLCAANVDEIKAPPAPPPVPTTHPFEPAPDRLQ